MTLTPPQIEVLRRLRWVPFLWAFQMDGFWDAIEALYFHSLVEVKRGSGEVSITPAGIEALKEIDND